MTLEARIFLESRTAVFGLAPAGHLYLVKRYVDVDENGNYENIYRPPHLHGTYAG